MHTHLSRGQPETEQGGNEKKGCNHGEMEQGDVGDGAFEDSSDVKVGSLLEFLPERLGRG